MQIGEVIRKYRKEKDLTQEEVAQRLGVTAPAVNKWENGNSMPDIALLAPIARLLEISLDTLLDYQESLSPTEMGDIIRELDARFERDNYDEAFHWAKKMLEKYPNCDQLICQVAAILNARLVLSNVEDKERYEAYIVECLKRALHSSEESVRTQAADCLFILYMQKEAYSEAEKYLEYYSVQNPERKRKLAFIYSKTGRRQEAFKTYEELLLSFYQMSYLAMIGIMGMASEEKDMDKVHYMAGQMGMLAKAFAMGRYNEVTPQFEVAVMERDAKATAAAMRELLDSVEHIMSYCRSPLYSHMVFREDGDEESIGRKLKDSLVKNFQDVEGYGFLKGDPWWEELCRENVMVET